MLTTYIYLLYKGLFQLLISEDHKSDSYGYMHRSVHLSQSSVSQSIHESIKKTWYTFHMIRYRIVFAFDIWRLIEILSSDDKHPESITVANNTDKLSKYIK